MKKTAKIAWSIVAGVMLVICFFGWRIYDTWRGIPEAYAAWDAGTLLVCYMEGKEKSWPKSWDDLESIIKPYDECVFCRGVTGDGSDRANRYVQTIAKMKKIVRIDWEYKPTAGVRATPVTRLDGSPIRCYWENPNQMIFEYVTNGIKDESHPL
jgi:hypothetical protein